LGHGVFGAEPDATDVDGDVGVEDGGGEVVEAAFLVGAGDGG
jgi:hypothetical protein